MTYIEQYKKLKDELWKADRWRKLIGNPFNGGGGGVGYVTKAVCSMEIYHQEYHGANNYHLSGEHLDRYLSKAVIKLQHRILDVAFEMMNSDLAEVAKLAHEEMAQLAADAGLTEGD